LTFWAVVAFVTEIVAGDGGLGLAVTVVTGWAFKALGGSLRWVIVTDSTWSLIFSSSRALVTWVTVSIVGRGN
jgi:hypothetical protein